MYASPLTLPLVAITLSPGFGNLSFTLIHSIILPPLRIKHRTQEVEAPAAMLSVGFRYSTYRHGYYSMGMWRVSIIRYTAIKHFDYFPCRLPRIVNILCHVIGRITTHLKFHSAPKAHNRKLHSQRISGLHLTQNSFSSAAWAVFQLFHINPPKS